MQCLFMMAKINYYLIGEKIIAGLQKNDRKPRLLLHACCAPCSSYPLTYLCPYFDVTIYYANSNIYPQEEYLKRLNELKRFLKEFEKKEGFHIDLVIPPYNLDVLTLTSRVSLPPSPYNSLLVPEVPVRIVSSISPPWTSLWLPLTIRL